MSLMYYDSCTSIILQLLYQTAFVVVGRDLLFDKNTTPPGFQVIPIPKGKLNFFLLYCLLYTGADTIQYHRDLKFAPSNLGPASCK